MRGSKWHGRAPCSTSDECHLLFALCADYCFGEKKFGGNAQAITRKRWLHHTTFLWDFDRNSMELLKHPANAPAYREVRRQPASLGLCFDALVSCSPR